MPSVYDIDLMFYKEMKIESMYLDYNSMCLMAREMIYYNHLANKIMFNFLSSNEDITSIIENLDIISLDEYMEDSKIELD
jgi:hypothetical protein